MKHLLGPITLFLSITTTTAQAGEMGLLEHSNILKNGHFVIQSGFISAHQGKNQNVTIQDLIGDNFSVSDGVDENALIGLGYYLDGYSFSRFNLQYGINAYYMFPTEVNGYVKQEDTFTNLSYQYKVTNIPIYAAAKALFNNKDDRYQFTLDAGIGPNIISTSHFSETPLFPYSLADSIFKGATQVAFSANVGAGVRINQLFPKPVECGYRFFYLGTGNLDSINSQVTSNLSTGNSYAHSLVCGLVL